MDRFVDLSAINFNNIYFWKYFFFTNYLNAYNETDDLDIQGIIDKKHDPLDIKWVNSFTQYYDGVMDDKDGYLENPTTLRTSLDTNKILKIEFHPGDTLFYINDEEIGCTGPHWKLQILSFSVLKDLLNQNNGELLFLLLLPLAFITKNEIESAQGVIEPLLSKIFSKEICCRLAECIINGLVRF